MNPGEKFQREMMKLGLGVSISIGSDPSVSVTTYCANCKHVAPGGPDRCPKCGADLGVLPGEEATAVVPPADQETT